MGHKLARVGVKGPATGFGPFAGGYAGAVAGAAAGTEVSGPPGAVVGGAIGGTFGGMTGGQMSEAFGEGFIEGIIHTLAEGLGYEFIVRDSLSTSFSAINLGTLGLVIWYNRTFCDNRAADMWRCMGGGGASRNSRQCRYLQFQRCVCCVRL